MIHYKRYDMDFWLFLASLVTFVYILFMNVAYAYQWDQAVLRGVMELITVPILLIAMAIPLVVIFRFISKKAKSRKLAIITIFISLLTAIFIGFVS